MWRAYKRNRSPLFREAVTLTLDHICQGGIYDHLGGFARYSTDETWLVPHFEKMLYDNAQLIELLCDVWLETASPLYGARIRETVTWALNKMRVKSGSLAAFSSALDADSEGEEGLFYIWSEDQIDDILGANSSTFKTVYDVKPHGNWESKNILNRSRSMKFTNKKMEASLALARKKLLQARSKRNSPSRDDKVLADWNGLMICALAKASVIFREPDWLAAAQSAYEFVVRKMCSNDRLYHTWCKGRAAHPGVLEDYASMSRAALILAEVTGLKCYVDQVRNWINIAEKHFWDSEHGGYFMSADDTKDILVRSKPIYDNATPSGNGTMAKVLARVFHLTGENWYRERLLALNKALIPDKVENARHQLSMLMGFEILENLSF